MHKKIINVIDYGADASGRTDSTQAFKDALLEGLPVDVPRGHYAISGRLEPNFVVFEENTFCGPTSDEPEESDEAEGE